MAGSPSATLVVAIPSVQGRGDHLDRCLHAYHETIPTSVELLTVMRLDRPTCGEVWNEAAEYARTVVAGGTTGRPIYLHCTADDLEPLPGWYEAAVDVVEGGGTPSALIYTARPGQPDVVESHGDWGVRYPARQVTSMSRIPFCRAEQWIPIPPIHYFSDNAFSSAMFTQGIPIVADPDFAFRHWWAQEARKPMNDTRWFEEQTMWQTWATSELLARAPRWT